MNYYCYVKLELKIWCTSSDMHLLPGTCDYFKICGFTQALWSKGGNSDRALSLFQLMIASLESSVIFYCLWYWILCIYYWSCGCEIFLPFWAEKDFFFFFWEGYIKIFFSWMHILGEIIAIPVDIGGKFQSRLIFIIAEILV